MILKKPKVNTTPIFNNIIEKIAPIGCLTLASSSDLTNEILFSPFCNPEHVQVGYFLIEVLKRIPATEDSLNLRWSLLCAIGSLSNISDTKQNKENNSKNINLMSQVQNDFSSEMALSDFASYKDQITKQIMPYISKSHNKINDKIAHNISFYLILFRNERPGIFYTVLPLLNDLIANTRFPRIFKAIGLEIFSLFTSSPIEFISTLGSNFCEEKDLPSIFSYPINFTSLDFTRYLQTTITLERYPYPTPFYSGMTYSVYCSLLNSSIEKNLYVLDLINEVVMESLVTADIESVKKMTCMFPELLPYFLIVYQNMLYGDLDSFSDLLETTYPPSKASDVIIRFRNDYHLIQLMTMLTKSNFSPGELLENSIPFHLMSNNILTTKTDDILAASSFKYFLLSDSESESDFDFIRSMAAFRIIMNIIVKPVYGQVLKDNLEKMYNYINGLQNAVSHINLIIDIFSLIFMKNKKDNSYACTPYIAYKLSETLVKFKNSSDYIIGTYELFLKKKPKKSEQSLDPYFVRDMSAFYNAIKKHEWETAEKMTIIYPHYKKLYTKAYDAYRYVNEGIEPWKSPDLIKLNVGLSDFGYRNVLKTLEPRFPNYSSIIEERIRSQESTNPIPTSDQWNPVDVFVSMFESSPLDMVKKIPDFLSTLSISKNLYQFLDEIWIYYSCAKCGNYFHANSIEDLFVFDIFKALAGPVEVGEYQKALRLSKEAKIELIPFIFENLDYFTSFDESFIVKMNESYPAATSALLLTLLHPSLIPKDASKKQKNDIEDEEKYNEDLRKCYQGIVQKDAQLNRVSQYLSLFESENSQPKDSNISEDPNVKASLINRIILASNDKQAIDDLIYTVDHSEVYEYLMTKGNYTEEKLATSLYTTFSIVSYVAPDSDKEKIDRINIRHKVHRYTSSKNPSEIVRDIMIYNNFDLALEYLKTCVPSAETASPLCQLFTSSLSHAEMSHKESEEQNLNSSISLTFVDDILTAFPERFDVILSRFFHIPGIIKTLSKYATDEKKDYMKGLSHLPELIFSDSNIFSIDTIVDSYIRNYHYIFEITPEIAKLFTDEKLFSMVKGVYDSIVLPQELDPKQMSDHNLEHICIFNDACVYLYTFFEDKNILINYWISYVESTFQKFGVIKSSQIEWSLNYYLQKIQIPLRLFISNLKPKESTEYFLLDMIKSASLLISHFPYSRLGIIYSLKDSKMNSPEFGQNILSISTKIDEDNLVKELSKSIEFNLNHYFLKKTMILFELSKFDEGFKVLNENKLQADQYDKKVRIFDTTFSFLAPLNKLHFFVKSDFNSISDPAKVKDSNRNMDIYNDLRRKVIEMKRKGFHVQTGKFVDDKITQLMYKIIFQFCRKKAAIPILISFKQFEGAYTLLMKEKDIDKRSDLFIHSFFIAVQFNNTNDLLKKFLLEKDPNLDQTSKLWINAIDFFKKKSMLYSLDFVYTMRNQLDDASLMEVKLFKDCVSFEKQVHLLGQIIYNLETSLNFRKRPCSTSPPFIKNESISTSELQILMEKSILQLNICSLWIERGIPFSHDLDIISSMESATEVAAILYLNNSQELLKELQKLSDIPTRDITSKVCEVLSKEPVNKVIEFWNNLKKHKATLGPNIPYELLKALAMSSNRKILHTIIFSFFSSDEERCKLLIEYDYIAEAYMVAQGQPSLTNLIPLIGKRASLLGDLSIFDNCMKILSKKK